MATDPVCGMTVEEADAPASFAHESVTYYFCSEDCRDAFAAEPGRYLEASGSVGRRGLLRRLFGRD